jgi:hypothetical protein
VLTTGTTAATGVTEVVCATPVVTAVVLAFGVTVAAATRAVATAALGTSTVVLVTAGTLANVLVAVLVSILVGRLWLARGVAVATASTLRAGAPAPFATTPSPAVARHSPAAPSITQHLLLFVAVTLNITDLRSLQAMATCPRCMAL